MTGLVCLTAIISQIISDVARRLTGSLLWALFDLTWKDAMGLSTHVLDTTRGKPAGGMAVSFYTTGNDHAILVKQFNLNHDGRNPDGLLYDNASLKVGTYRLVFDVSAYFKAQGVVLPEPNFLNVVTIDFGVADVTAHYHVPLLVSPWSYSTYRGS